MGIISNSREGADKFYHDFLGLTMTKEGVLPAALSEQLFSFSHEITMLVYERDGIKIEIFICPECEQPSPDQRHLGLYINDLSSLLEKAGEFGVEHITGQKGDRTVHFLKDFSGNLIEIKEM
ncbi:MAG: hypothetical protein JSU99_08395 [Nitrospiraceae bacterium]|nr:MAG: hypothetical protein JSU99_08395 [Nitrospiraceae bacterium]